MDIPQHNRDVARRHTDAEVLWRMSRYGYPKFTNIEIATSSGPHISSPRDGLGADGRVLIFAGA